MVAKKNGLETTVKPKRDSAVLKLAKDEISYLKDFIKTEYLLAEAEHAVQNRIDLLKKFV